MTKIPVWLCRWLEVDLDKLAANLQTAQAAVGVPVIAVVKNDAYGFGAAAAAGAFVEAGAQMLAVTTLDEALELREAAVTAPILVFTPPVDPAEAAYFAEYQLTATLDGERTLAALAAAAPLACHIKLNTGMNRFGVNLAELPALLAALKEQPQVRLTGLYSHLATALEPDCDFARRQLAEFTQGRDLLAEQGFNNICCHLANSAGALKLPESRFDAVRMGSLLYAQLGLAREYGLTLAEPFCAKARIAAVRELKKGETVGYGREFTARRAMRVAVLPFGYGDGFGVQPSARPLTVKDSVQTMSRSLGKLALGRAGRYVYYQQQKLPVLGRVAMQNMLVDIGDLPLQPGDILTAPLRRTAASARLPRLYFKRGELVAARLISQILQAEVVKYANFDAQKR